MFDFEKFRVYQRAETFYAAMLLLLRNKKIDGITSDQLKRASLSIVLTIAEGAGKFARNDKKNFYTMAMGSTNECIALLRVLRMQGLIAEENYRARYGELTEISKMLTGLIAAMARTALSKRA